MLAAAKYIGAGVACSGLIVKSILKIIKIKQNHGK
jgi:hypothetical protein